MYINTVANIKTQQDNENHFVKTRLVYSVVIF